MVSIEVISVFVTIFLFLLGIVIGLSQFIIIKYLRQIEENTETTEKQDKAIQKHRNLLRRIIDFLNNNHDRDIEKPDKYE